MGDNWTSILRQRVVFLDRDGIINLPVVDPASGLLESPYHPRDVTLVPGIADAIVLLRTTGAAIVIVSNQPAAAKGKATLAALTAVADAVRVALRERGADVDAAFYCHHHPDGVDSGLGRACDCRKPADGLLRMASRAFGVDDLSDSWLIGDSDVDVLAAHSAGARAVLVEEPLTSHRRAGRAKPERTEPTVLSAAMVVASEMGVESA